MDQLWKDALWQQFGASIDMFENALVACPETLWHGRLWGDPSDPSLPPGFASFWYVTAHTLFWLDLYLTGSMEGFAPPAPFNPDDDLPERPYTKDELHGYLVLLRKKCQTTIAELSDERQFTFPWPGGRSLSFLELQLYNMRHVQEHAAQLSLFLGQHGIPDEALDWVGRAKANEGGE
jgi:hypothetical protein